MSRPTRTTKELAQRINLNYFRRPTLFRRLLFVLSIAFSALGLLWIGAEHFRGKEGLYNPRPVASAHAVFGFNCNACHVSQAGTFRRQVTDQACLACHDGPIHHEEQTFTPACSSCHLEHQGAVRLARTDQRNCTQCHADLKKYTREGVAPYERTITGFNTNHPQFAPLRPGRTDPSTIKFDHKVHLKKDLCGPNGPVQLLCADCHRPTGLNEAWPYGDAETGTVTTSVSDTIRPPSRIYARAYMAPLNYMKHCSACHPLLFDKRFTVFTTPADTLAPAGRKPCYPLLLDKRLTVLAPHKKPEIVHQFLINAFTQYIAKNPGEVRKVSVSMERLPNRPIMPPPKTAADWVSQRVMEAERLLWGKTCKECHALSYPAGASLPVVAEAKITPRWLPHASFNHEAHQMLSCTACHTRVTESELTADVLLPGIRTCQQCHREGHKDAAEARCFECHVYHDWSKEKRIKGRFSIPRLLGLAGGASEPPGF
jgi:hypothetical protein